MSTKTTRTTRAASFVGAAPGSITPEAGKALAAEYRAQDKAEGTATLKRARVAYVLVENKQEGKPFATNPEIAELLGVSAERIRQMHVEVGMLRAAGFDLSQNDVTPGAVSAHREAMRLRKVSPSAPDAAKRDARKAEIVGDVVSKAAAAKSDEERAETFGKATQEAAKQVQEERKAAGQTRGAASATAPEKEAEEVNPRAAVKTHLRAALAILSGDYAGTFNATDLDDIAGLLADLSAKTEAAQDVLDAVVLSAA